MADETRPVPARTPWSLEAFTHFLARVEAQYTRQELFPHPALDLAAGEQTLLRAVEWLLDDDPFTRWVDAELAAQTHPAVIGWEGRR